MAKIEYPQMIYLNGDRDNHIVVQNKEEHDEKKKEGYSGLKADPSDIDLPEDSEASEFTCTICGFPGKNDQSLRMHTQKKHRG